MEIIDISQNDDLVNVIRKCNLNFRQVARSSRQELDRQSRIDTSNLIVYVDDSIDEALGILSTEVQNMIASKASKSEAISGISRNDLTFTATRADGTTFTFTQKDDDTWVPNTVNTDGYVTAPTVQNADRVWKTDSNGNPGWRQESGGGGGGGISLEDVYPVGSIYLNASDATNPATLLGFGTWERLGQGRMMIDADTTYTAGGTGGSATHNHSGSTGGHAITVDEMPSHNHTINHGHAHTLGTDSKGGHAHKLKYLANTNGSGSNRHQFTASGDHTTSSTVTDTAGAHTHSITGSITNHTGNSGNKGGGDAHSHTISSADNMPPWIGVYMWKRVA